VLPWSVLPRGPRTFPANLCFSQCASDRLAAGPVCAAPGSLPVAWRPPNLPEYLIAGALVPGVRIA